MYPATLNIHSVYFLNSPNVVTRLLFNIYKPISDSYVKVILPGNGGGGGGGGEEKILPLHIISECTSVLHIYLWLCWL